MVSSGISVLNKTNRQILLPMDPPDAIPADQEEFDFSDVFGPTLAQPSIDVDASTSGKTVPQLASDRKFNVAPLVIHNRSHSLVGPSPRITQFSQGTNLTLHETESSLEIVECSLDEDEVHREKPNNDSEKSDIVTEEVSSMTLEDFQVLKVVGQGAFGKVFQVKRKGTSEIYAMKVMRKDKIMEKNHAEYMKAERDILTKVDHPFVVQLRYSFQVCTLIDLVCCYFDIAMH